MTTIPGTFVVFSPLEPEAVIIELKSVIGSRSNKVIVPGQITFRGMIRGNRFTVMRTSTIKNPFARNLTGVVHPSESGSRIEYTLVLSPIVRIMFAMWFVLVTIILLVGIISFFTNGPADARYELILLPIILLAAAIFLASFGLNSSMKSENEFESLIYQLTNHPLIK